ncbi:MAG: 4Fe-4S dicluster domain-containing protein [Desulfobacterales bacterium]|nr:4Fe-4S dicluster domain-containing protein [Desulfobacterales bacterium]MBF0396391.1 4Fe-4S dicluster domain-containing protein [Desulfobacterales bacterium]
MTEMIQEILKEYNAKMKLSLKVCAHCSLCAESCFMFIKNNKNPIYMPSYKFINSIGKIYKKKGNVDLKMLEDMKPIIWKNCVLCTRCYCPLGIDIPSMISLARTICRMSGVYPQYNEIY